MALKFVDRLLTVVVTATLTSAAWILFGSVYLRDLPAEEPAPEVTAEIEPPDATETFAGERGAASNETVSISTPERAETSQLIVPVQQVRPDQLIDTFSDERGGGKRLHEAIDIMAPAGTTVVSAAPGTVERLFLSDAGGNTIYVRSDDGRTIYYYAHLQDYAEGLREGQKVRRGQRLGSVGSSGNADPSAPHLHFALMRTTPDAEWWEPSTALNPYPLLTGQ